MLYLIENIANGTLEGLLFAEKISQKSVDTRHKICYHKSNFMYFGEGGIMMATESLHFPDYFPKNCPPDEATDDSLVIYRLCREAIPTESDFISYYQLNPKKYKGMIQAYGLSVFSSMEDCIKAAKKSPALRDKYKFCSCGENTPERGRTLATPSKTNPAHITWWVYEGVKPHTFFVGCTEGGGNNE